MEDRASPLPRPVALLAALVAGALAYTLAVQAPGTVPAELFAAAVAATAYLLARARLN